VRSHERIPPALRWAGKVGVEAATPGHPGIDVSLVGRPKPWWFETWLVGAPIGRLTEPCQIVLAVAFLAARPRSRVTGTVLTVGGGHLAI
jgi:NAD(P)-dependent dehydrogenase (short-subunit alcohol dehydrogenase family)